MQGYLVPSASTIEQNEILHIKLCHMRIFFLPETIVTMVNYCTHLAMHGLDLTSSDYSQDTCCTG